MGWEGSDKNSAAGLTTNPGPVSVFGGPLLTSDSDLEWEEESEEQYERSS